MGIEDDVKRVEEIDRKLSELARSMQETLTILRETQSDARSTQEEYKRNVQRNDDDEDKIKRISHLTSHLAEGESALSRLQTRLNKVDLELKNQHQLRAEVNGTHNGDKKWPLSAEEYKRYGRQLIMPEIGMKGQLRLKSAAVLVVGAGGLGCPAAAYLAGAGVGTIGLVDGDEVEISNLHRQIAHSSARVGDLKVDSAIKYLRSLNPLPTYVPHRTHLSAENGTKIFQSYNVILDCTDHPTSRYLISDLAVLLGKPLVSASALQTDGQLMLLNNPPAPPGDVTGGPCYRCIFPKPPPAESVLSCGDGGILGPVVGVMGVLQALETIKVIVSDPESPEQEKPFPSMLLFSAFNAPQFRSVKLRGRRKGCAVCSAEATITEQTIESGSLDYIQFCGVTQPVNLLSQNERISARDYHKVSEDHKHSSILVDVREKVQFDLCSLDNSVNIPFSKLVNWKTSSDLHQLTDLINQEEQHGPIYVVCRFGNDSQVAVKKMKEFGLDNNGKRYIGDIQGGWRAWHDEVDLDWPDY